MSISLDPLRLRFLLQQLHGEFPAVDYNSLVRVVMMVERGSETPETMEAYVDKVRGTLLADESVSTVGEHRHAKIFRQQVRAEVALISH